MLLTWNAHVEERDIEYFSCERMNIHEYILLFLSFPQKRKFDFPLKTTTYNVLVEQHLRKRRKYRERKYLWQKDLNFTYPKSRRSLTFSHNAHKNRTMRRYIYRWNRGTKLVKLSTQFRWHQEAKVSHRENKITPFREIRRTRFRISFFHIFRGTRKSLTRFDAGRNKASGVRGEESQRQYLPRVPCSVFEVTRSFRKIRLSLINKPIHHPTTWKIF